MQSLTNDRKAQELALSFCAKAAYAVAAKQPGKMQLVKIDKAMSHLFRLAPQDARITEAGTFIDFLEHPLPPWLDPSESVLIDDQGSPTDFCQSIIDESGHDPEAERTQRLIADSRTFFATLPDGDARYASFRKQLIQSGHADMLEATALAAKARIPQPDLFQAIPATRQHNGFFFPCPVCSWPMPIARDGTMACESLRCRQKGAVYHLRGNTVVPLAKAQAPRGIPSENMVQAKRGIWRYTIQPGLAELELEHKLTAIAGVSITMWPHLDSYDLHIQTGEKAWKVDVKDWSNPISLGNHVTRSVSSDICIVIPNDRVSGLAILRESCPGHSLFTIRQFVQDVRQTVLTRE